MLLLSRLRAQYGRSRSKSAVRRDVKTRLEGVVRPRSGGGCNRRDSHLVHINVLADPPRGPSNVGATPQKSDRFSDKGRQPQGLASVSVPIHFLCSPHPVQRRAARLPHSRFCSGVLVVERIVRVWLSTLHHAAVLSAARTRGFDNFGHSFQMKFAPNSCAS